jgi:hypothetical protein
MVNPVQLFPDWIPAFAGMTGCGLCELVNSSGNGYKPRDVGTGPESATGQERDEDGRFLCVFWDLRSGKLS